MMEMKKAETKKGLSRVLKVYGEKRTKPRGGYEIEGGGDEIGGVEKMRLEGLRNNDNKREIEITIIYKRNYKSKNI